MKEGIDQIIKVHKSSYSGNTHSEKIFEDWWKAQASSIQRKLAIGFKPINIEAVVHSALTTVLGTDAGVYIRVKNEEKNR